MDYFSILNLSKEPFSNSPDPDYFFQSRQHVDCLQKLELSLRLKRGLNVVIGDVGTGKTTLCRQLLRRFAEDEHVATHLILDPYFSTPLEFLKTVAQTLTGEKLANDVNNEWQIKEIIKKFLYQKGVDDDNLVILIIDEGQKISTFCLELLREFLNYETNEYKLLQIAIFAQREFEKTLEAHANFADRISLYHRLQPMNFKDTRLMIRFRLQQSGASAKSLTLFTYPALWAIYRATRGYPRKIVNLCHRCVLAMIIQNRAKANWFLVRSSIRRTFASQAPARWRLALLLYTVLTVVLAVQFLPFRFENLFSGLSSKAQTSDLSLEVPRTTSQKIKLSENTPSDASSPAAPAPPTSAHPDSTTAEGGSPQPLQSSNPNTVAAPAQTDPDNAGPIAFQQALARVDARVQPQAPKRLDEMLPLFLGHVTVRRHETLGGMIQKIYGLYNNSYLNYITKVNPTIVNPDNIRTGELILFPAIPAKVEPLPVTVYWVSIDEKESIEEGYNVLRRLSPEIPSARLIPYWNQKKGLRFKVILRRYFFDENSAQLQLDKMAAYLSAPGRVLSDWDNPSVFFANPY